MVFLFGICNSIAGMDLDLSGFHAMPINNTIQKHKTSLAKLEKLLR